MKQLRAFIITGVLAAISLFWACEIVEAPYIEKHSNGNDTGVVRRIVLEEFTGHRCTNCPTATQVAHDLKDFYGDKLILVSIHASFLASPGPVPYTYDFRTDAGDDYEAEFGVSAVPTGMVSRRKVSGSYLLGKDKWGSEIAQVVGLDPDAKIDISTSYSSANRKLDIDISTEFLNTLTGTYNLIVLLTEDGVIKPQMNNDTTIGDTPDILDYEHNHVLRTAVNGSFGEAVSAPSDSKTYSITLDQDWNEDNISVVAYLSRMDDADGTRHEIIQAEVEEVN